MRAAILCDGTLSIAADGAPLCSGTWVSSPVPEPFDVAQLDPAMLGQAFAVGLALAFSVWLLGYPIGLILKLLK
ncbi:hypothetical protein [Pseudomonas tohonis]|uniref:hypothetical protein n=1 Tax=Pseudomonas tohonis TaxID=2725477 RepID=UPI001F41025F|nr:hypothetical protein [Pseudomonas tohonis]GJN44772.1 hypothetical protein TUM20249_07580 [Pseudomonas tohonis]